MKPIICHLCNFSPETAGTFVDAIVSLAAYSRNHLHLETLCFFPHTARERKWLQIFEREKIHYAFVPRKRSVAAEVRRFLKGFDPLIFHSHFSMYDLCPPLLKFFYSRSKIVWHYHNPTPSTLSQRLKDTVRFQLIARPFGASYIAVGDGVYRSLIDAGVRKDKLFLVHNGVDTQRFVANDDRRTRARLALNIADDKTTTFLMLGWDPVRKGVDIFVKAARDVIGGGLRRVRFLIIGDLNTKEFLAKTPECSQLDGFLNVIDPTDDFPSLLSAVDVLVSSSRSEGLSYAVAEALAAKKLAICSDIPGVREAYERVDGVWLFPSEDSVRLAEFMRRAATLPVEKQKKLGESNREYVLANYSLDRWAEKIGEIYCQLLQV